MGDDQHQQTTDVTDQKRGVRLPELVNACLCQRILLTSVNGTWNKAALHTQDFGWSSSFD